MRAEIIWNPVNVDPPRDRNYILVAATGYVFVARADWRSGKPVFVDPSRIIIHAVEAWASLPKCPDQNGLLLLSSKTNSMPDVTIL
jgi:hypothetical protein